MARIAASTVGEIVFRQTDSPPARTQKLELMRQRVNSIPSRAKLRFVS